MLGRKWTIIDSDTLLCENGQIQKEEEEDDYFFKFSEVTGWRMVLMLQFQMQWVVAVIGGIYISYIAVIMATALAMATRSENIPKDIGNVVSSIIYSFDVFYFIDVAFMIVFRNIKWTDTSLRIRARHGAIVFIEFVSLIPLELIYYAQSTAKMKVFFGLRLRYILRLVRLTSIYVRGRQYIGTKHHTSLVVIHLSLLVLLIATFGCFSYVIKCKGLCPYSALTAGNSLGISLYLSGAIFTNRGVTSVFEEDALVMNASVTLLVLMLNTHFLAYFICEVLHTLEVKYTHVNTYTRIVNRVEGWYQSTEWRKIHVKYLAATKAYYETLWENNNAVSLETYLNRVIPPIMYREILFDISVYPLKHSHLFQDKDMSYLSTLCAAMKHVFFMPGEVIYMRNEFKTSMIYIVSGIVDVLAEEDSETVILSLTSGTCLGESTLIIDYPSVCSVICKTTCEMAILHRRDFFRISKVYRRQFRELREGVLARIRRGEGFIPISKYNTAKEKMDERVGVLKLKIFKHTMRKLLYGIIKIGDVYNRHPLEELSAVFFYPRYLNMYVMAKDNEAIVDSIFTRKTFPYIFKPNTVFLKVWYGFVLLLVNVLVLTFPYYQVFVYTERYNYFLVFVSAVWIVDLYLNVSTAIETEYYAFGTLQEIIKRRIKKVTFVVDVLSIIPADLLVVLLKGNMHKHFALYSNLNRLLKIYKLETFFGGILTTSTRYVLLKYIKFVVYVVYLMYYSGAVLYLLSCHHTETCTDQYEDFLSEYKIRTTPIKVAMSFYGYLQIQMDMSTVPFPYIQGFFSSVIVMLMQMFCFVVTVYFLTYTSAAEALNQQHVRRLISFERNLETTMKCFDLSAEVQQRIQKYVELQASYFGPSFMDEDQLLEKLPRRLYLMACDIEMGTYIKSVLLFGQLNDDLLARICTIGHVCLLPAGETIIKSKQFCSDMYIVLKGHCLMRCVNGQETQLNAGDNFCVLETCLNVPSLNEVASLTTCKLLSINYGELKTVLLHCPNANSILDRTISYFANWNEILLLHQSKKKKDSPAEVEAEVQRSFKIFGYNIKSKTIKYYEFHDTFPRWGSMLKYVLLRYTFHTNGLFTFYWEITRCITILISCTVSPFSVLISNIFFLCLLIFFNMVALVDIYVRHHISYYNKDGLEVTHPYKTAVYYWKHSFFIDLISALPLDLIPYVFNIKHVVWFYVIKLLPLYRLHGLIQHLFRKRIASSGIYLLLQYIPSLLIFYNYLAAAYFSETCQIDRGLLTCKEETWLSSIIATEPLKQHQLHVFAWLFGICAILNTNISLIHLKTRGEIIFHTCLTFFGYVLTTIVTAKTISANLTLSHELTSYQKEMHDLKKFLSYKRIDKNVPQEVVNYFENMWYMKKRRNLQESFALFTPSFKADILYCVYKSVLKSSTIFSEDNETFFKDLLGDATQESYLKRGIIHKVNDVSDKIYVLLSGEVEVVGADQNRLLTLNVGSVFGHLDNCPLGRRTLTMVAVTNVEVLVFSGPIFHHHLSKCPNLLKRFRKLTAGHVDYLEEVKVNQDIKQTSELNSSNEPAVAGRFTMKTKSFEFLENVVMNAVYMIGYVLDMYSVTTQHHPIFLYVVLYACDLLHLYKMILKWYTPFREGRTALITDAKKIRRKYVKSYFGFYFDLFSLLPFEVLCFFFASENRRIMWSTCRLNRLVRVSIALIFLRNVLRKLNTKVFLMEVLYLLSWFLLINYTLACFLHLVIYKQHKSETLKFFRSLHMVMNIVAKYDAIATNIDNFNYVAAGCFILVIIAGRIVAIIFLAECCALVKMMQQSKYNYLRYMLFMNNYMKLENVSLPLYERILNYLRFLWIYHRGVQYPSLLNEAPYYLREAVLNCMFGFHLRKHPILSRCHVDLIRQMAAEMEILIFFPGNVITYGGESDQSMYFIHEGEVIVLREDTVHSEVIKTTLHSGDMFGFNQGMYRKCCHEYTYRAITYTVVVLLKRDKWFHLLDFFPASKVLIYNKKYNRD